MSQANGQQNEQIQDLGIKASYTGCSMGFLITVKHFEDLRPYLSTPYS